MKKDPSIEALIKALLGVGDEKLPPDQLCNCGTCTGAIDVAIAAVEAMYVDKCPAWVLQVAAVQTIVAMGLSELWCKSHDDDTRTAQSNTRYILDTMTAHMAGKIGDDKFKAMVDRINAAADKHNEEVVRKMGQH